MRFSISWLLLILLPGVLSPKPSWAEGNNVVEVGVRAGFKASNSEEDFVQCEVFSSYGLPWTWSWPSGWFLGTRLNSSFGALTGGGDTGVVATVGPGLVLSRVGRRWAVLSGISPTLISEDTYGNEDLGGHFHFTSHLGISYQVSEKLNAAYRIQHMSNASLNDPNPGLDLHMFELKYRF